MALPVHRQAPRWPTRQCYPHDLGTVPSGLGLPSYCTDVKGDIVVTTDGQTCNVTTKK
jgi:hypothetical protein